MSNTSSVDAAFLQIDTSSIKNKQKRTKIFQRQQAEKTRLKSKEKRAKRKKTALALGEDEQVKKKPQTIDSTREVDETLITQNDEEIENDEAQDEFANYFTGSVEPKIIITSCYRPTKRSYQFIRDLLHVFPNSVYYARKKYPIKTIVQTLNERGGFTDLLIINEDHKEFNALTHIHLPNGPTAYYKMSSVVLCDEISNHGNPTSHHPEVILNNFNTRLGHRVGRMLGSLIHQKPEFRGRRVVTFHNQRDFIFFRHHRYIFTPKRDKAELQELGPRFTLKLQWLQHGTFDTQHGEFEWMHKNEMDTSRRRFFL